MEVSKEERNARHHLPLRKDRALLLDHASLDKTNTHNTMPRLAEYFVRELPNTAKFRSVELENFSGNKAQHILSACAHALECLTIIVDSDGIHQLLFLLPGMTNGRLTSLWQDTWN